MRNGRLTPGELKRALRLGNSSYKRYVEAGMPKDIDDDGIITHDLAECAAWLDENTAGSIDGSKVEKKTIEEANVLKSINSLEKPDYDIETVMINDCECLVKTKGERSTVQVNIEVDVPADEVQAFAEEMTTTIYEYQEV